LPVASANAISRQFQPKDALLATKLPLSDGGQLTVFNTHLERASQPDDTALAQVSAVAKVLDKYESQGLPWLIAGDFNLLPLGQYRRLPAEQRTPYSADSELHLLWDKYPMIPTNNEASGIDRAQWLTHYPNDPGLNGPDRTVDYLFYSPKIKRVEATVRQDDTLRISDHLPVIARFLLPAAP
jgi:endonuclease/exonuclease/phosphatase (EEP) superfamily protein YafD